MSPTNKVSDPEAILTVVDPRPEEEVLAQYATESLHAEPFAEKPTVEDKDPEKPEPEKKKKGGALKMILIGCVGLGCLVVVVVVLLVGAGAGGLFFWGSSGDGGYALPSDWSIPEDWSMPEMGGDAGDEAGVDPVDSGEEGDAGSEDGGETAGADDDSSGAAEEDAGEEDGGEVDAGEEDSGQEDAVADETPTPAEVVEIERPQPTETIVSVTHQAATMSFVGDSIALSATTPGFSRCKVIVVYRGAEGGSWKKQSMSRGGENHTTSLTVSAEMAPEF